jgi:hypothetical protein
LVTGAGQALADAKLSTKTSERVIIKGATRMPGESSSISRRHIDEKTVFLAKWWRIVRKLNAPAFVLPRPPRLNLGILGSVAFRKYGLAP